MKQYRRMICYLYEYIRGEKGQNVGYIRLEQRGEQCRVQLQMRMGRVKTLPEVQFFKKRTSGMYILPVGSVQEQKGQWVYRLEGESGHLQGTDHSLEEMDGMILPMDENCYYASSWNLETIPMGEREPFPSTTANGGGKLSSETASVESQKSEEERVTAVGRRKGEEQKKKTTEEEMKSPEQQINSSEENRQKTGTKSGINQNDKETTVEHQSEELDAAGWSDDTACVEEKTPQINADSLMEMFPKMMPFGNQTDWECVRLEPKDIGCLPMKWWFVSGNPFLMQGYYNYRHLILAKMQGTQYGLGVPGVFSAEMRKQAERCGFPMFRSICGNRNCPGAFGYWLMPLDLG